MNVPEPRIPVNDLSRASDLDELVDIAAGVIRSGRYLDGDQVSRFEDDFSAYGHGAVIAVGNGTDALEIALRSVGCEAGQGVVTAANAGFYTSTAILRFGGVPIYADVDLSTAALTPATVEDALRTASQPPRPSAVVVTHLYGLLSDVRPLAEWCLLHGVPLIEDCAQAIGARLAGRLAGTFGDVATFSFYPTKNLGALGDGGAVTVPHGGEAAVHARRLRQYGWNDRYVVGERGGCNSRLDEIQAAFLRRRLRTLATCSDVRRSIAARYADALPEEAGTLLWSPDGSYVGHLAVVVAADRRRFRLILAEHGVDTAVHYPVPDHLQPVWHGAAGRRGALPVTEMLCDHVVTVPCFAEMTDREISHVCEALASVTW